ncbi:DUF5753 domain-containing protein [Glycomyces rhizosphaerae]|uniref:DUF5753 domain-containing protein n=1 Tax=Glycomyces rhizosphaerae TaxID=2054422 RepID=A0ABV7Q3Y1_9ACTN
MSSNPRFDAWAIRMTLNLLYGAHGFGSEREGARFLQMNHTTLKRMLDGTTQQFDALRVKGMAMHLGASPAVADQLFELAAQTHNIAASGYQQPSNPGKQHADSPFGMIISRADRIDIYEDNLIPGELQLVEYMDALVEDNPFATEEGARRSKADRRARKEAIFSGVTPDMRVVLNEHVLLRIAHEPFFDRQVGHLIDLTEQHNVGIYVLPVAKGLHPAMSGAFTIMGFSNPVDLEVVYLESYAGSEWVEELDAVAQFRKLFKVILQRCEELGAYLNGRQ